MPIISQNEARTVFTGDDRLGPVVKQVRGEIAGLQNQLVAQASQNNAMVSSVLSVTRALPIPIAAVAAAAAAAAAGIKALATPLDELNDAAQNANVAATALANLRIGARETGLQTTDLDKALAKLNTRLTEARGGSAEARLMLDAAGVDWRDTSLAADDALKQLANTVSGFKDGASKAAFVAELLGEKLGPKFIAYLNQGGDGLERVSGVTAEAVAEAVKLSDELDKLSAGFDRLKNAAAGWALPKVNALLGLNDGPPTEDRLAAITRQLDLLAGKDGRSASPWGNRTVAEERAALLAQQQALSTQVLDQFLANDADKVEPPNLTQLRADEEDARKAREKSAEAARRHADALAALRGEVDLLLATQIAQAGAQDKLNEVDQKALRIAQDLAAGKLTLAELERSGTLQSLADAAAVAAANAERKRAVELQEALGKSMAEALGSLAQQSAAIEQQIEQQRAENAEIGLSVAALAQVRAARINDAIATKQQTLAALEQTDSVIPGYREALEAQIKLLEQLRDLKQSGAAKTALAESAKEAESAWRQSSQVIEQTLLDALMAGFDGGLSAAKNFTQQLKNLFQSLVLRPIIQPVAQATSGAVLGAFGMPAAAAGGSSAGGLSSFGSLGNLASLIPGGGLALGNFMGGATGAISTLGAEGLLAGTATNFAGIAGSIGAGNIAGAVGLAMPYAAAAALAVMAIRQMMKKKAPAGVGYSGAQLMGGDASLWNNPALLYGDMRGLQGFDPQVGGALQQSLAAVSGMAAALGGSTANLRVFSQSSFSGDANRGTAGVRLQDAAGRDIWAAAGEFTGQDGVAAGMSRYIEQMMVVALKQSKLPARVAEYLSDALPDGASAEQLQAVIATASAARTLWNAMDGLGGAFGKVANLSIAATDELAGLTGGFDAFLAKTQGFVANFFSRDEQAGVKAAEIQRVLADAGITTDFANREQFRSFFDSIDPAGTAGREQLAALLNVQGSFAGLTDYLAETGKTLGSTAAQAPGGVLAMVDGMKSQTDQLITVVQRLEAVEAAVFEVVSAVRDTAGQIGEAINERPLTLSFTSSEVGLVGASLVGGN